MISTKKDKMTFSGHSKLNTFLLMVLTALASVVWWSLQSWTYHVDTTLIELETGRRINAEHISRFEGTLKGMQDMDRSMYEAILRIDEKTDKMIIELHKR